MFSPSSSCYGSLELHEAIRNRDYREVKALLADPGVDVECANGSFSPFQTACAEGGPEIVRLFLDCGRPVDYNRGTFLHCLIISRDLEILKMLTGDPRVDVNMNFTVIRGRNLLHLIYALPSPLERTKILLACDTLRAENAIAKDVTGVTPLQCTRNYLSDKRAADLLDAFIRDPQAVRCRLREELGDYPEFLAGELFAAVVLLCDDYLKIKDA